MLDRLCILITSTVSEVLDVDTVHVAVDQQPIDHLPGV